MHLSAQEEYGLRCLVQLARHDGDEPMRIQEIARAEGLSGEYVAKLMRILRNGELVDSTRGASGGYRLRREPARITLWEAIQVLGGPLFPESFCDSHPGTLRDCVHSPNCSIRGVWRSLNDLLRVALSGITLDDLKRGEHITAERLGRDWFGEHIERVALSSSALDAGIPATTQASAKPERGD